MVTVHPRYTDPINIKKYEDVLKQPKNAVLAFCQSRCLNLIDVLYVFGRQQFVEQITTSNGYILKKLKDNKILHTEKCYAKRAHGFYRAIYKNGLLHNDDDYAVLRYGSEYWFKHGICHRDNGPAVYLYYNGTNQEASISVYIHYGKAYNPDEYDVIGKIQLAKQKSLFNSNLLCDNLNMMPNDFDMLYMVL